MAPRLKRSEIVRPLLLLGTLVALILVLVSLQVAAA